ncbi:hypothetical protein THAOC_02911 [Thalassiosira oceanica]|uniref:Helicase C-terminal domain-containing protein n=1 Tax=Thalassiosira oceanica TaxID=159749 RepID=K0TQ37_THAOC|nr:hypothetical protein THAOC_02911 [Thalassiosira oceanica]|eukprot:EJK75367.1 hypothetical protein THAOC_02911 [Thalassiosira oceanica]
MRPGTKSPELAQRTERSKMGDGAEEVQLLDVDSVDSSLYIVSPGPRFSTGTASSYNPPIQVLAAFRDADNTLADAVVDYQNLASAQGNRGKPLLSQSDQYCSPGSDVSCDLLSPIPTPNFQRIASPGFRGRGPPTPKSSLKSTALFPLEENNVSVDMSRLSLKNTICEDEDNDDESDSDGSVEVQPPSKAHWKRRVLVDDSDDSSEGDALNESRCSSEEDEFRQEGKARQSFIYESDSSQGEIEEGEADESMVQFDGCGCWAIDDDSGDLYLAENPDEDWPRVRMPLSLYTNLYQHQRIGVQWMASLHDNVIKGGILADDMGMGKTYQVLSHIGSLMRGQSIANSVIVAPKSVIQNWEREANLIVKKECVQGVTISAITSEMKKATREKILAQSFAASKKRPHVVIITYGLVSNHIGLLTTLQKDHPDSYWDYVILDEDVIEASRQRDASSWTVKKGKEMTEALKKKLEPYFLQRLKKTEFGGDGLPTKEEICVFCDLSKRQREIYAEYTKNGFDAEQHGSPLSAITWLKMLCGHPLLVKKHQDSSDLLEGSAKLQVLLSLLLRLQRSNHRTLVFSQSTKMLDIIERVLDGEDIKMRRIDGSTGQSDRQKTVDSFNDVESDVGVLLLSTKACGVGLTLTGADRAILFDISWNPSEDSQAVDRCYRIGQKKPVKVYRLLTAGTVEEKIYERQVHKNGIRQEILSSDSTARYFNSDDLADLFTLGKAGECKTLKKFHAKQLPASTKAGVAKRSFLSRDPNVVGVANHDDLYESDVIRVDLPATGDPFSKSPFRREGLKKRSVIFLPVKDHSGGGNEPEEVNSPKKMQLEGASDIATKTNAVEVTPTRHKAKVLDKLLRLVDEKGDQLKGPEKLDVHRRIAEIGVSFGWLDTKVAAFAAPKECESSIG